MSVLTFAQNKGITYQAVIYSTSGESIPGIHNSNSPLVNKLICLQFSIVDDNTQTEYQEKITVTTDDFGMVNLIIGNGTQTGGYASSFNTIVWSNSKKYLKVSLDQSGACSTFEEISNQLLTYVPFALAADSTTSVSGIVGIANGGTNATTVIGAKTNLQLQNVDNTSDVNKPISAATQTALNLKAPINNPTFTGTVSGITKAMIGLTNVDNTSDLNKPISIATQTAVNLKEDVINKSTDVTVDGTSDSKYPSVKAIKSYVDNQVISSSVPDATSISKGKIQLAGDLSGTALLPTVPGLALKAPINNPTFTGTVSGVTKTMVGLGNVDDTSDLNKPISTATQTALNAKEDVTNKSTAIALGTSDVLYPTQKAVKTYVDTTIANNSVPYTGATTNVDLGIHYLAAREVYGGSLFTGSINGMSVSGTNQTETNFIGSGSMAYGISGGGFANTALGHLTLSSTYGDENTAIGSQAMRGNYTGARNTALGRAALGGNQTGNDNTALGAYTSVASPNLTNTTAIGAGAIVSASNTIQLGNTSVTNVKTSGKLTSGAITLPNTDGTAGQVLTTNGSGVVVWSTPSVATSSNFVDLISNQTIAGNKSFSSDITVNGLTIGKGKGQNAQNTAVGAGALNASTANGTRNTAVGAGALQNYRGTTFDNNTGVGYYNMIGLTTGYGNTSIGAETMFNVGATSNNTAIGNQSLINAAGDNNVGVGARSGDGLTTGTNNTFLGTQARTLSSSSTIANSTALGYGAIVTTSNTIQLGNTSVTDVNTSGKLTTGTITLPNTDGTTGQVLTTNGSGVVAWSTPSVATSSDFVDLTTNQTVAGVKTFNSNMNIDANLNVRAIIGTPSQVVSNEGMDTGTWGSDQWQSFIATSSGLLDKISVFGNGSIGARTGVLTIYKGTGIVGVQVYSDNSIQLPPSSGWFDLPINTNLKLESGQVYTFRIEDANQVTSPGGLVATTNNKYTQGDYYSSIYGANSNYDLTFKLWLKSVTAGVIAANEANITEKVTASGFKTPTGTSSQYLMADGSVSNSTLSNYLPLTGGNLTGVLAIGTTSPQSSAVLDLSSTTQGFLPPRMTQNQRNTINNPVAGLVVWCKNCGINGELQVYNGTTWTNMVGGTASAVPINLGDSYGGGTVIYLFQSGDSGYVAGQYHGIIIANDDAGYSPWGCNGITTNATGTIVGTSTLNTTNIIASNCGTTAAQLCVDYRGGGYTDWVLPSIDELNIVFTNRAYLPSSLSQYLYWSSSETSSAGAYRKDMRYANTGSFQSFGKTSNSHVRAVRYF